MDLSSKEADQVDHQPAEYICQKQLAPGITVHVVAVGANLMQCWAAMKQGTRLPVHSHPHEQSSYIISGSVRWTVDGRDIDGLAGTCMIFRPNQPHGALVVEDCVITDAFTPVREDYLPA